MIAPEVDGPGFETNLSDCSTALQQMVGYLRTTAEYAGPDVAQRRYRHPKPNTGWGVSYYAAGEHFCDIHPKKGQDHAWVSLKGVDSGDVARDGFEPSKQDGWFVVHTMLEAVRIGKWILLAHDARA